MRNRTLWMFVLLALMITVPMVAEEAVPQAAAATADVILPGINTSCEPVSTEATEQPSSDSLEMVLDGNYGATDMTTCWTEDRVIYTCTCFGNTRYRRENQSRTCCDNGWCSGWSTYSSSCTNFPCP